MQKPPGHGYLVGEDFFEEIPAGNLNPEEFAEWQTHAEQNLNLAVRRQDHLDFWPFDPFSTLARPSGANVLFLPYPETLALVLREHGALMLHHGDRLIARNTTPEGWEETEDFALDVPILADDWEMLGQRMLASGHAMMQSGTEIELLSTRRSGVFIYDEVPSYLGVAVANQMVESFRESPDETQNFHRSRAVFSLVLPNRLKMRINAEHLMHELSMLMDVEPRELRSLDLEGQWHAFQQSRIEEDAWRGFRDVMNRHGIALLAHEQVTDKLVTGFKSLGWRPAHFYPRTLLDAGLKNIEQLRPFLEGEPTAGIMFFNEEHPTYPEMARALVELYL